MGLAHRYFALRTIELGTSVPPLARRILLNTEPLLQLGVLDQGGVSLRELVDGLNAMGVTPRDMITILQAIKAAGALQAEIEVL